MTENRTGYAACAKCGSTSFTMNGKKIKCSNGHNVTKQLRKSGTVIIR